MEIADKKMVVGIVIIMELVSLCYIFPKMSSPRAVSFENLWARLCINSEDLFKASEKLQIVRPSFYVIDDRVSMYYADLTPKPSKKYLLYFDAAPFALSQYYDPVYVDGQKIYLLKGLTWDQFIKEHVFALEEYLRGDFPCLVRRKEVNPYAHFTGDHRRDHGEK